MRADGRVRRRQVDARQRPAVLRLNTAAIRPSRRPGEGRGTRATGPRPKTVLTDSGQVRLEHACIRSLDHSSKLA